MVGLGSLAYVVVAVLLPVVPAYLLYRLLPSSAEVEGPLQGLQIKLGGAFAGYFLLVITLLGFWKTLPAYEVWAVEGRFVFSDEQGDPELAGFSLLPPSTTVYPDGRFRVSVFAFPDQSGNTTLPTLVVEHPGYRPAAVDLGGDLERSRLRRSISIREPLELHPVPLRAAHTADDGEADEHGGAP